MKVWLKLVLGAGVGILIGIFLPVPGRDEPSIFFQLNDFILSVGRYALFPFVFFSAAVALNDLRQEKKLGPVLLRSLIYMVVTTFVFVVIGALFMLIFTPEKIQITSRHESALIFKSWNDTVQSLVPKNVFQILTGGSDFLLPLYALSFVLGLHFHFDRGVTQPTVTLFDSLSRIFYHLNSFIVEILGIGMIVLSGVWLVQLRMAQNIQLYFQVFLVLSLATATVLFAVIPALLYFFGGRENPYKQLFGLLGAGVAAFFSGDSFFSLGLTSRLARENLGIPRKVGALNLPLFAMFGRAGTAMTSTIAFFIILKSYSDLEITYEQILWTISWAFLFSFALPAVPNLGVYINLSLMCSFYGGVIENGYLNLQPILPILVSFSALLDVFVTGLCSFLVARHEGVQKEIASKLYI